MGKFPTESEKFLGIGGNLKKEEMHNCLRGMDLRPCLDLDPLPKNDAIIDFVLVKRL